MEGDTDMEGTDMDMEGPHTAMEGGVFRLK